MSTPRQPSDRRQNLLEVLVEEQRILGEHLRPVPEEARAQEDEATLRGYSSDCLAFAPDTRVPQLKTMGLALSGGGIRAASFALGVMQGLNQKPKESDDWTAPLLSYVDYLSTVSGGGYAGAAFTYYRHLAAQGESHGLDALDRFPEPESDVLNRRESRMIDFTRFRRNHLTPSPALNVASLAAIALRTVLLSWPIYLSAMALLMMVVYSLAYVSGEVVPAAVSEPLLAAFRVLIPPNVEQLSTADERQIVFAALLAALAVLAFLVISVLALICSRWALYMKHHYVLRRLGQRYLGKALVFMCVCLVLALTPLVASWVQDGPTRAALAAALLAGNAAGGASLLSVQVGGLLKPLLSVKAVVTLAAGVLLLGNVVFAYEIAELVLVQFAHWAGWVELGEDFVQRHVLAALVLDATLAFAVLGYVANINYVSLHRMYRDRLMEAFMPDLDAALEKNNRQPARKADKLLMKDVRQRPIHFVNTNVVLSNSSDSRYRGRAGDNFILAPHYCGSWATGWRATEDFSNKPGKDEGMTLATAMAISGAAVNPRVGPSGWATPLSHPIASAMASFLNLRLGCWVANPAARNQSRQANFYNAGLKGLLNSGFSEDEPLVELTDGGHFENTGIYELLRRRAEVIVFCDASADKEFNFKDLGIAIERARVDLSVEIEFPPDALAKMTPGSGGEDHYAQRYGLAHQAFAVATIRYPSVKVALAGGVEFTLQAREGLFIYLKSVMTPGLPTDIYSYCGAFKEFPYQPITDQMFDESQFEAYRELGFGAAAKMHDALHEDIRQRLRS